jgi:DNA polymerase (family 10)
VHFIGHPSGRLIPEREPADIDMEALFAEAARHGVALEIDSHPSRLDLSDAHARRAAEVGCLLAINTDAHSPEEFALREYGVGVARRAWLTPAQVITARRCRLVAWLEAAESAGIPIQRPLPLVARARSSAGGPGWWP